MKMISRLGNLLRGQEGASAIEYAVLVALIAGVVIVIIAALGGQIQKAFSDFVDSFTSLAK
jgi:pilus assembly protein Flp/PilA